MPAPRRTAGTEVRSRDIQMGTRRRRKVLAHIRATQPNCHLCGYPIDTRLDPQRHPLASCGDEILPRAYGGSAQDYANVAHAHRLCNGIRGVKPLTQDLHNKCKTAVDRYLGQLEAHHDW